MQLYKVKASLENVCYGLMARDEEGTCYVYSANTGLWHRDAATEIDFEFEDEAVYEPITGMDAADLLPGVKPADPRDMGRYIARLEQQEPRWKKTSAEGGIINRPGCT